VRFAQAETETAELGLAPLIDVVLLLLIFFLVTTSFATPRIPLELPGAQSAEPPRPTRHTVVLTAAGGLYLDEAPVTLDALGERLAAPDEGGAERELELRADREVPHGRVVEVLDRARRSGIEAVGVAVAAGQSDPAGATAPRKAPMRSK